MLPFSYNSDPSMQRVYLSDAFEEKNQKSYFFKIVADSKKFNSDWSFRASNTTISVKFYKTTELICFIMKLLWIRFVFTNYIL